MKSVAAIIYACNYI